MLVEVDNGVIMQSVTCIIPFPL